MQGYLQNKGFARILRVSLLVAGMALMAMLGAALSFVLTRREPHIDTANSALMQESPQSADSAGVRSPAAISRPPDDESPLQQDTAVESADIQHLPENGAELNLSSMVDTSSVGSLIATADEKLRAGNYVPALRDYLYVRDSISGSASAPLQFRLALCAELMGNFSEALDAYRRLTANGASGKWSNIGTLGETRCLSTLSRFDVLMSDILRRVLLDESAFLPTVRGELIHLIARSQWTQLAAARSQHLLDDQTLVVPNWHPDPNQALNQLPDLLKEESPPAEKLQLTILQTTENSPDGIYLCIHSAAGPSDQLLTTILERCQLECTISETAAVSSDGRSVQLHVRDRSLSLILDGMTIPYGNIWQFAGRRILITSSTEVSSTHLVTFQQDAAERLLRAALLEDPRIPHSSHTRLALASLLYRKLKPADAVHILNVQLESSPGSRVEAETAFNLGKCQLNMQSSVEARKAFLRAMDSGGPATEVRVAAYLYAGRLQIEQGNIRGAVGTCLRGLALSEGTSLEPDATLLLASTYLLLGSPQGANGVLMERRSLLNQARYRDAGAFVSAYARFTATVLADRREREARNLVSAISFLHPERQFGSHWCLLAAQAAEDIGLTQQAQEAYLQALSQVPPSALRNQVILKLAALYRTDERFQEASHLLTSLTPEEAGQFSHMAALRAAEISLELGKPNDAVSHCRRLLQQDTSPEVLRATLRVMGHAYEKLHNHEAAVYCFAGVVPDPAMDTHLIPDESTGSGPIPGSLNEVTDRLLSVPKTDAAGGVP